MQRIPGTNGSPARNSVRTVIAMASTGNHETVATYRVPVAVRPATIARMASITAATVAAFADPVAAHVSEQALVLLLPTDVYISAGIAAVVLTVLVLAFLPGRISAGLFRTVQLPGVPVPPILSGATSLLALALLASLLAAGITGTRDPLGNPLPLFIWTVWWMGFVVLQGAFGNLWTWVNPFTGLGCLLASIGDHRPRLRLPERLGSWPGVGVLLAFGAFYLAYPAPDDPDRLAWTVIAYLVVTFAGMVLFGSDVWLTRCETFTMLLRLYARLAPVRLGRDQSRAGFPGWEIAASEPVPPSLAVFALVMLGVGSFDGLNETFWWLSQIGVNPLEFPGRSAIIAETVTGIIVANVALVTVFGACVWAGLRLAQRYGQAGETGFVEAFGRLALSIIPIAFAYHIAHFLTAFLINGQYALVAASDPFGTGADLFGFAHMHVTAGFFNTLGSVRVIWLTQAGAVVIGHIIAILLAHAIAMDMFGSRKAAAISQIPLATFMILYTLLGLWLLASPRGA